MKFLWNQWQTSQTPLKSLLQPSMPSIYSVQLSTLCVEGQRDGWSFDNRSLLQTAQRHLGPVPERTAERRFLSAGKLGYDGITTSKNYVT